eukprot:363407-Chlamydomonas_euryale.AAC.2
MAKFFSFQTPLQTGRRRAIRIGDCFRPPISQSYWFKRAKHEWLLAAVHTSLRGRLKRHACRAAVHISPGGLLRCHACRAAVRAPLGGRLRCQACRAAGQMSLSGRLRCTCPGPKLRCRRSRPGQHPKQGRSRCRPGSRPRRGRCCCSRPAEASQRWGSRGTEYAACLTCEVLARIRGKTASCQVARETWLPVARNCRWNKAGCRTRLVVE